MESVTRRGFFIRTGIMCVGSLAAGSLPGALRAAEEGAEVSPAEDLMREHGLLRRVLFIYREWTGRLRLRRTSDIDTLAESGRIIRAFVESYHEKLEEDYLFPRVRRGGKLVELVDVLEKQHQVGRRLTDEILRLADRRALRGKAQAKELARALKMFVTMYEPHAAREDTVLFGAFHEMMSEKEYDELGDTFEAKETEMFGESGFEKMVGRVASLEARLGIYDLARFTPRL
jgi:hemerythrin-like domain-containing protein